ncbi:MAG: beta-propeller fold lactonase family protein [Actinomycetes bacterium]
MANSRHAQSLTQRAVIGLIVTALAGLGLTAIVSPAPAQAAVGDLLFNSCVSNGSLAGCVTSPVASLDRAGPVVVSPDNRFVYVASEGSNTITRFNRDSTTGALAFADCISNTALAGCATAPAQSLAGAFDLSLAPDGTSLYVASGVSSAVTAISLNTTTGSLTFNSCISNTALAGCTQAPTASLGNVFGVATSPDGRFVYSGARASSAVTTFSRNTATGTLTVVGCLSNAVLAGCATAPVASLEFVQNLEISPDGASLYATDQPTPGGAITAFTRNTSTGALTFVNCITNVAIAGCTTAPAPSLGGLAQVVVSPDGKNVYAAGRDSGAVTTFVRSPGNGALTFASCISSLALAGCTTAGANSLRSAYGMAISWDGLNIYVAAFDSGAMTAFTRNTSTGVLAFNGCFSNTALAGCTTNPAASLASAIGVAVSPNGASVYVGAQIGSSAVTTYSRVSRSAQWAVGCGAPPRTPKGIARNGLTRLAKKGCRTNAGQSVKVTVKCRALLRGDQRLCRLIKKAKGETWIRTYGYHLAITVTWSAPAKWIYLPYRNFEKYRT